MNNLLRKITFLFLFALVLQPGYSQSDIVKLKYKFYTSWFSTSEHIPIVLEYTLTKEMLTCSDPIPRAKKFTADLEHDDITSLAKDYRKSGYDRGHNMNAEDNKCDADGMRQCFYYSNMTPQPHSFNAGRWEDVERLERTDAKHYGEVIVTTGSVGKADSIGEDAVVVPKFMWKVIYIPSLKTYQCYCFPDANNVTEPLSTYEVTLKQVENLASVNFREGIAKIETE